MAEVVATAEDRSKSTCLHNVGEAKRAGLGECTKVGHSGLAPVALFYKMFDQPNTQSL